MYTLLIAIIYLAFISLGLPDSLMGAAWPTMHLDFAVPVSYMGILSMIISGCTIVSSLFTDRLVRRFGTGKITVVSVFLTSAALFGFSLSKAFWLLIIMALPYGFGAGAIDASLNNYVAQHYSSRHMSWLHCFWGIGTIVGPFTMAWAITNSSWNSGYRIISVIQLCIAIVLLLNLKLWTAEDNREEGKKESAGFLGALKIKGVSAALIGFFAYCAVEATAMGWASTYLVESRGVNPEKAASYAALFCIGITVGRFLSGFISNKLGDRNMTRLGQGIMLCGILSLLISSEQIQLAGFVLIGFGCAPVYPSSIHSTPSKFGSENSGVIIGMQMAAAYVGTTFIPPLYGMLGNLRDFGVLPFFLLLFWGLMVSATERSYSVTGVK